MTRREFVIVACSLGVSVAALHAQAGAARPDPITGT